MTATSETIKREAKQRIAMIDSAIDRIRRKLCSLETIDSMSAESWQSAWDKHPDLHEEEQELFRKRGQLQLLAL